MKEISRNFLHRVNNKFVLGNSNVLEIGCGNGEFIRELALKYPDATFTAVDLCIDLSKNCYTKNVPDNLKFICGDISNIELPDNTYDFALSKNLFEHISDLCSALSTIRRVLKPGGTLYSEFSPIWTSVKECHNVKNYHYIKPWAQLYCNEHEFAEMLTPHLEKESAEKNAYHVYNRVDLNRLSRKEYYNIFISCGMVIRGINEYTRFYYDTRDDLSQEIIKDAIDKVKKVGNYDIEDMGVGGFRIHMEKHVHDEMFLNSNS